VRRPPHPALSPRGRGGTRAGWPRVLALALILIALGLMPAGSSPAQQFPAPPLYALLPPDYPYPLIRVCYTAQGICAVPFATQPGQPCACQRPDGYWVRGVCTH
jgi:hypothetical protein